MLARDRIERPDIFTFDENEIAEIFLHQRQHRHAQRRDALASHALPARAGSARSFSINDTDVELHTIPLFHANGWGRPQSITMMGVKQVMVRRFEPASCCA